MAVAYSEFRNLIGRIDNDNRPGFFAVKSSLPRQLPKIRTDTLELEYDNLATRLEPETGMLWAHFLHRERACFTAELLADCATSRTGCATRSAAARARRCRSGIWSGPRVRRRAWNMGGNLASFTSLIRDQDEAELRSYAYRCDRHSLRQLPRPRPADHDRGPDPGRRDRRRLRGDADQRRRHRRAHAKFGLPEILFNLFPGMGAHSFLRRRVGDRMARVADRGRPDPQRRRDAASWAWSTSSASPARARRPCAASSPTAAAASAPIWR